MAILDEFVNGTDTSVDDINAAWQRMRESRKTVSQAMADIQTEVEKKLDEIINETPYSNITDLLFAGLSAFGFVLVFGGVLTDALVAFVLGILVRTLDKTLNRLQINSFFSVAISAAVLTILALSASFLQLVVSTDSVIIGTIMLLVPGLAITNAVRDSIAGDLISGLARGAEALLIAVAVALVNGAGMIIWIWMGGMI